MSDKPDPLPFDPKLFRKSWRRERWRSGEYWVPVYLVAIAAGALGLPCLLFLFPNDFEGPEGSMGAVFILAMISLVGAAFGLALSVTAHLIYWAVVLIGKLSARRTG